MNCIYLYLKFFCATWFVLNPTISLLRKIAPVDKIAVDDFDRTRPQRNKFWKQETLDKTLITLNIFHLSHKMHQSSSVENFKNNFIA